MNTKAPITPMRLTAVIAGAVGLALSIYGAQPFALARASLPTETRPVTDRELVRNGGFDRGRAAWATNPIGTYVDDGFGLNGVGKGMQIWPEFSDPYIGFIYQELYLPSNITAAAFQIDYQFVPDLGPALDYFVAILATETDTLVTMVEVTPATYPGETWQSTGQLSLDSAALAALNSARADGDRVWMMLQIRAQSLRANVDNVSLVVSGSDEVPTWSGSIAYIGLDAAGYAKTIKTIDPDGGDPRTVWTHPQSGATNAMHDVAWKPDGSELAFGSNHETLYSAFQSDAYGIEPDGSDMRRISNPPSKAELDAGGYQVGTIAGAVYNNYGSVTSLLLYIQGAPDAVAIPATGYQEQATFSIPNVAYLGPGSHYAVFIWAAGDTASCREYAAAVVHVVPGQTVDVGTLQFGGTCGEYNSDTISWKRDGTEVSVDVITPRRFPAAGGGIGTELFSAPLLAGEQAWSPVDDRILYYDGTYGQQGIYLTAADGDAGIQVVADQTATWVTPAWLPDGSGFVFTLDNYLYHHDLGTGQANGLAQLGGEYALNPSVSPDGRYVAFERWDGVAQHDLWIADCTNPVAMWQLTSDGRSTNPDWSRTEPGAGATVTLTVTATPSTTATATATATETTMPEPTTTTTDSPSATPTATARTPTSTVGPAATGTASPSGTTTQAPTATASATATGTRTPVPSATATATPQAPATATETDTQVPSATSAATGTAATTPSPVATSGQTYEVYLPIAKRDS